MNVSLVYPSGNSKTGPIATSMSERASCPSTCPLAKNGCYAETHHTRIWWDRVTAGTHGFTFDVFLQQLKKLPSGVMFRHNVAGDLPHTNDSVSASMLQAIDGAVSYRRCSKAPQSRMDVHAPPRNGAQYGGSQEPPRFHSELQHFLS